MEKDTSELSNYTVEQYELACRQKFARENIIYERLITHLRTRRHAPGLKDAERKQVLRRARNFRWGEQDQRLYRLDHDGNPRKLVVRSFEELAAVLEHYHSSPTGGHSGWVATWEKVSQVYYWRNMNHDIKRYIATCSKCQHYMPMRTQTTEMCPIKVTEPWEFVGVNLIGKSRRNKLKDNYRKSLKKTSTKRGQNANKKKFYKYSEHLSFLKKYIDERETKRDVVIQQDEENNQDNDVQQHEDEKNIANDAGEPTVPDVSLHEDLQAQPLSSSKPTFEAPGKSSAEKLAKPKMTPQQTAAKLMAYLISKQQNQTTSISPHPVDAFLASIAPTLKTLTPYYLNVAKSEIFATVQKYEMQMLMNQHSFGGRTEPSSSIPSASTPLPSPQPFQEHTTAAYEDQFQKLSVYTAIPKSTNSLQDYFLNLHDS